MTDSMGSQLIFLISQPRAGSTLLQRMLATHSDIYTTSEPWLMLHPLYALRDKGHSAQYNAVEARNALTEFLKFIPGGEERYIQGIRQTYLSLYNDALSVANKLYFLDKTPRYYWVIPELMRTFPEAHFIILLRNPLAVLCSILNTWVTRNGLYALKEYEDDLLTAPALLVQGIKLLANKAITVNYEQLLLTPEDELQRICTSLGIKIVSNMSHYGDANLPKWKLGDPQNVYRQDRPQSENADRWIDDLIDPQFWRLSRDYLHILGREMIAQLGYSFEELEKKFESKQLSRLQLLTTSSMKEIFARTGKLPRNLVFQRLLRGLVRFIRA